MSRNFLASPDSRDFKRSPNRNRIVRAASPLTASYFVAGERAGDVALGGGQFTFFPFPTYGSTAVIEQHVNDLSMPFDTMRPALETPYVVGDIFQMILIVEGISELYDPEEAIDVQTVQYTVNGNPQESEVLYRETQACLAIADFEFLPQHDTLQDDPLLGQVPQLLNPITTGQLLLLNRGGQGGTEVMHWKKRITVTVRALVNRPNGYPTGAGARSQTRNFRVAFVPSSGNNILVISRAARRNADSLNAPSSLVPGINIVHTPTVFPAIPAVLPSATMFIGKVVGWEKVGGGLEEASYVDLI